MWCSFILRRLVIGCLEKCTGIVKKEVFTFLLYLLKICMRERRLRIRMLEKDLKDFLIDIGYIKDWL